MRAQRLSKRFFVLKSRKTALRAVRAVLTRQSLKREHWVLRDLTFEIGVGDRLALIGRNGSGKTTLLRILAGIYQKTSGELVVRGSPRALFSCTVGFRPELAVLDNLYLFGALHGVGRAILEPRERAILERTGLEQQAYSPLKELSTGQAQRLALAVFSQTTSDFLIFDEVIANVDHGFRLEFDGFFAALARSGRTLIMTSHDATVLRRHCRQAIWLHEGQLRRFGPVDEVIDEYEQSFGSGPVASTGPVLVRS